MKKSTVITLIVVTFIVIIGASLVSTYFSVNKQEIALRNGIPAQTDACDLFYTKLWKILEGQAGIVKADIENQKDFAIGVMEGRYSTGEKSMMWITEQNPKFDRSGYETLMNSVDGLREGFFIEQVKLRDMALTHKNLVETPPKCWFVAKDHREPIEVVLLVNKETKTARETGIDEGPDVGSLL